MKKMGVYMLGLLAITGLLITGCSTPVHVEKDQQTDFSRYKTFAWINENSGKKSKANDLEDKNVHDAVSRELRKSSWREVSANPDVLISYDVLIERTTKRQSDPVYSRATSRLYFNPYTRRYGTIYYPSQFWGYEDYNVPVREGTLTITVTDASSDKTIWQGWTTDEVDSRRLTSKELANSVKSIFRKFDVAKK
ncbi:MAG: DUF4136 domain-containing protein [Chitinophagaceae bacterium]